MVSHNKPSNVRCQKVFLKNLFEHLNEHDGVLNIIFL